VTKNPSSNNTMQVGYRRYYHTNEKFAQKKKSHQKSLITKVTVILHFQGTQLDYFVFQYMKDNVFKNRPGTIPELMQVITDNCNLIDVPTLRRSLENMKRR
jgi:hypothetical protein